MIFERIESKGLAHYSYLVGDQNAAVVIDPRRDCDVYTEKATREGLRIAHVLETHRNEDYAIGSVDLDVRSDEEVKATHIPGAHHIHLTLLPHRLDRVPRDRPVTIFCGSGLRSMIAASLLRRQGWTDLAVVLGGLAGWNSTTCPLEL